MSATIRTGAVHAGASFALPTVRTISGAVSVPTPGAPVLPTPSRNAQNTPSAHCHRARSGIMTSDKLVVAGISRPIRPPEGGHYLNVETLFSLLEVLMTRTVVVASAVCFAVVTSTAMLAAPGQGTRTPGQLT